MLHLIFQSPIEDSVLQRIDSGDVIVFHENAIFALNKKGTLKEKLLSMLKNNIHLCVLDDVLDARGISVTELIMGIEVIDYCSLVELTEKNNVIRTWN